MILRYCKTCRLYLPEQKTCQLMPNLQGKITPEDYCSQHHLEVSVCGKCGSLILPEQAFIEEIDGTNLILCANCARKIRQ